MFPVLLISFFFNLVFWIRCYIIKQEREKSHLEGITEKVTCRLHLKGEL